MPQEAQDTDELKGLIAASRKRDLSFGLALGKKPEDTAFQLHRTKDPEVLLRTVKREDGVQAANSTFGTARTKGKTVELICHAEPPSGVARRLRLFLVGVGLTLKVRLLGADGSVYEEDGDDDGVEVAEDPSADARADETLPEEDPLSAADLLAERWNRARALLEPRVQALLASDPGMADRLRAVLSKAEAAAAVQDFTGALTILARIAEVLAGVPAKPVVPPSDDAVAKRQMLADLVGALREDMAALGQPSSPEVAAILALFQAGVAAARGGSIDAALARMSECAEQLAAFKRAARVGEARAAVPEGTVAAMVAAVETEIARWRANRLRSVAGLDNLVNALRAEEAGTLHDIAGRIDVLRTDLPEALETQLAALAEALKRGDTAAASRARDSARGELETAVRFLQANAREFRLCEVNPFGIEVAVVEPLATALKDIHASLARV